MNPYNNLNQDNEVEIKFSDIAWNVVPVAKEDDLIELQWGWTAGLTEEQLKDYAEDAPHGYESVTINKDFAKELIKKLVELL